jgi:PAS domain S-box-containing protein
MHDAKALLGRVGRPLLLTLAALLASLIFWPLTQYFPPAWFLLCVVVAAWFWGVSGGLSAAGASLVALLFLFRNLPDDGLMPWGDVAWRLAIFALSGGLAVFLGQQCRRATSAVDHVDAALAAVHDALIVTDTYAKVRYLNSAAEALTGWSLDDAMDQPLDKVCPCTHEDSRQPFSLPSTRVIAERVVCNLPSDAVLKSRTGQELLIEGRLAPQRHDAEEATGIALAFRDVTKQRQEERECRRREEQFRTLASAAPGSLLLFDNQGKCSYANNAWQTASELSAEQTCGDGWAQALHAEDRGRVLTEVQHSLRGGRSFFGECRLQPRRGESRWVHLRTAAMVGDRGQPLGHVLAVEDVEARKQAEAELRECENRITAFMRNFPGLTFLKDAAGRYLYTNDAYARALEVAPGTCDGKTDAELLEKGQNNPFCSQADLVLETGEVYEGTESLRRDGNIQNFLVRQFVVPGQEEDDWRLGGIALDISAQIAAEQALQSAREEFERKWQERAGDLKRAEEGLRKTRADLEKHLSECGVRQKQGEEALRAARQELEHRAHEHRRQVEELQAGRKKTEEALKAATDLMDEQAAEHGQTLNALRQQLADKDAAIEMLRQKATDSDQLTRVVAERDELEKLLEAEVAQLQEAKTALQRRCDELLAENSRLLERLAESMAEREQLQQRPNAMQGSFTRQEPRASLPPLELIAKPSSEAVTHQILVNSWRLVESMDTWRARETPVDWLSYN